MMIAVLLLASLSMALGFRLWKCQKQLRLLTEHSTDIITIQNKDGDFEWVSPSVTRILGYDPREWVDQSLPRFIHIEDFNKLPMPSQGEVETSTFRVATKKGGYVWMELSFTPNTDWRGRRNGFISVLREVSKRKKEEKVYRFLIRHLPNTSVFLFDKNFRHLVAEGSLSGHTLPPSETLKSQSLWGVFPEDIASTLAPFYKSVFDGSILRTEQSFRTRIYRIHFFPVQGTSGDVELGMAVFQDVTDEKATIATLEDRTHDLERSNRDLEQFANVASHELKAPLRRIASFVEILGQEYRGRLSEEADEYISHIVEGVESLQSVIESLLTYSRVQLDRSHMTWVNANEVLDDALEHLEAQVEEAQAEILIGDLPERVRADATLLRQLFENLISNAIKFNTTSRKPRVRVTCVRRLLDWEFSVEDNGPGLNPAYRAKVFTMFQRLHPDVEGNGIGLALCKKIVGIHRGKIWFESRLGEGTTFKFTISAKATNRTAVGSLLPPVGKTPERS